MAGVRRPLRDGNGMQEHKGAVRFIQLGGHSLHFDLLDDKLIALKY